MTAAAAVTQAIGSQLATSLLWKEAGNASLGALESFGPRSGTAFGGRQAFSKSPDVVFDALRSVTGNCVNLAAELDRGLETIVSKGLLPRYATVFLPVLVVEGRLFEASAGSGRVALEEVQWTRVLFRGAERGPITAVDVVRSDVIADYAARRAAEVRTLLEVLSAGLVELDQHLADGRLEELPVTDGSRGMVGLPPLLAALTRAASNRAKAPPAAE